MIECYWRWRQTDRIVVITGSTRGMGLTQSVADETAATGFLIYAVLPGAGNTKLIWDLGLGMASSE